MYIGPWQEYNLSKTRSNRVNEHLRPGIEQALLNKLDPEAAKIALEAMIPYFEKPSAPIIARSNQMSHSHGGRKRVVRVLPALHSSVNSSVAISARERSLHSSSPLSVRSTQSEPIKYSKSPSSRSPMTPILLTPNGKGGSSYTSQHEPISNNRELPPLHHAPRHTQPTYNAPAMVNLLRLERNSKARSEIAKLTGWKIEQSLAAAVPSGSADSAGMEKKRKIMKEGGCSDEKIEQVNMMKQLYLSGGQQGATAQYSNSSSNNNSAVLHLPPLKEAASCASKLTSSNLAQHNHSTSYNATHALGSAYNNETTPSVPALKDDADLKVDLSTPRIGDIDLTDEAFSLVSKYFQASKSISTDTSASSTPALVVAKTASKNAKNSDTNNIDQTQAEYPGLALSRSNLRLLRLRGSDTPMNDELESLASQSTHHRSAAAIPYSRSSHCLHSVNNSNNSLHHYASKEQLPQYATDEYVQSQQQYQYQQQVPSQQQYQFQQQSRNELETPSNADELYTGGLDGLLAWSSQLELDIT